MNAVPVLMLLAPAAACLFIATGMPAKRTALLAAALNVFLSILLAINFCAGQTGYQFETNVPWVQLADFFRIHFHLGVDGINLPLILLTTFISLSAVAVAEEHIRHARRFYICLLLVSAGALGAFLSLDLFFFYIFHEVALVPTFLLIGFWGLGDRRWAAWRMTIYLAAGSLVLLAGLLALYFALPVGERTFDLIAIQQMLQSAPLGASAQALIFVFLLVGFGILVGLWPFHNWAPQGYAAAPVPAAMLHAGVLKKFGLYGLLRLAVPFLPEGMAAWESVLLVLLLFNILYLGLATVAQKKLNWMLGYSSIMHMGYLFLGLVCANVVGLTGLMLLMIGHGLSIALLFGLSGEIRQRAGTLNFQEMGGLASHFPRLTLLFMIGALAAIGLPGLANFSGEILIFFGAWPQHPWAVVLALLGVVISAVYMLRAVRWMFFGEPKEGAEATDLKIQWPYWLLATALVLIGCWPRLLTQWIQPSVKELLGL